MADDSFLWRTDPRTVQRIFAAVQREEKRHRNEPSRQLPPALAADDTIPFVNTTDETIPAGACMRMTGVEFVAGRPYLHIGKPGVGPAYLSEFVFNGRRTVDPHEVGGATRRTPVWALYDDGDDELLNHSEWGPGIDTWALVRFAPGFRLLGVEDKEYAIFDRDPTSAQWFPWRNEYVSQAIRHACLSICGIDESEGRPVFTCVQGRNPLYGGLADDDSDFNGYPWHAFNSGLVVPAGGWGFATQAFPCRVALDSFLTGEGVPTYTRGAVVGPVGDWWVGLLIGDGLFDSDLAGWAIIAEHQPIPIELPDEFLTDPINGNQLYAWIGGAPTWNVGQDQLGGFFLAPDCRPLPPSPS